MTDINNLIDFYRSFTSNKQDMNEEGEGETSSGSGGDKPEYPTVTKWETGVTRGPANQIGLTKWSDIVKINRGKGNTLI